ncbi:MAG: Mpo1-like protein [Mucilaginibacter sp.]
MTSTTHKKNGPVNSTAKTPADNLFDKYSPGYQTLPTQIIHWVCMLLIMFSLLGLTWAIPFPYLKFLGKYNGFFNWASFLIAIGVYYYYKISPLISYIIFFLFFSFSYGVMQADQWQKNGGPTLWLMSLVVFVIAAGLQFANLKIKNKKPSFLDGLQFLILSPVWLLHFVFKKR